MLQPCLVLPRGMAAGVQGWSHSSGSPAGRGLGAGMSPTRRAGSKPCREQHYVVATPGPWFPASNPAASPSSRRSKLKGRFMLSDPWGGGRLGAGIEAWHGSALLRCCVALGSAGVMGAVLGPWASGSPGSPQCPGGATLCASGRVGLRWLVLGTGRLCPGRAAVPLPGSAQTTNPLTAAWKRLHQPLCGKMVSGRSGEHSCHLGPRSCGT